MVTAQDANLSVSTERLVKLEDEICSPEGRIQIKLTWKSQAGESEVMKGASREEGRKETQERAVSPKARGETSGTE